MALDDLAGAGVGDRRAVAPAPGRPVHPLDDVVADVQVVGALRHHLHPERVAVAGRLERLVPPPGAVEEGGANRLRRPPVEVVHDGLDGLADRGRGVPLLEPVTPEEPPRHRLPQRGAVVLPGQRPEAGPRVVGARRVAVVGQLDERVVLAHRHRPRGGRHRPERAAAEPRPPAARVAGERQPRLELGVPGEPPGARQMDGAAALVEPVGPGQPVGHPVRVAEEERRHVDEHGAVRLRLDLEPPEHRGGERLLERPRLVGVVGVDPVALVGLHHQHLGADALEPHDGGRAELAPVEPDVVRSHPGRERAHVEKIVVEPGDLHPQRAGPGVPVQREEPGQPLHARRALGDGGPVPGRSGSRPQRQRRQQGRQESSRECRHGSFRGPGGPVQLRRRGSAT